ncbi:MAG TPA: hypothetical protein VHY37_09290, partial [Tepidisphaeraceae bacterium]|nr:hypothetical protein [Tepidisphaeraceae bacterium]
AMGVVTIAMQELPFGASIAGYSRYSVMDRELPEFSVQGYHYEQTPMVFSELTSDDVGGFDAHQENHVWVDDAVVDTVDWVSAGSMAGSQPLADIHPDLLQELFGQRLGMQSGANHSALNLKGGPQQVSVSAVYSVKSADLKVLDQYDPKLRVHPLDAIATLQNLDKQEPSKMLLVVRTKISPDAANPADRIFRFSLGTIRLVAPKTNDLGNAIPSDYYPVGTLENNTLYVDKPDDYLYLNLNSDRLVDLVFEVERWKNATQMPDPSFMEVKRLARVDLSDKPIGTEPPAETSGKPIDIGVMHVSSGPSAAPAPQQPQAPRPTPPPAPQPATPPTTPQTGAPPAPPMPGQPPQPNQGNPFAPRSLVPGAGGGAVLDLQDVTVSSALPMKLGTSADEAKKHRNTALAGGTADLRDGKAQSLTLDGSATVDDAAKGDVSITDLSPPAGKALVRVTAKPGGDNSWAWASHVKTLTITDAAGTSYAPEGVVATINIAGTPHVMAIYTAGYDLDNITPTDGTVTSVVFYIAVPTGTPLKSLTLDGKVIRDLAGIDTSP